jgi:hypothetical protein
MSRFLLITCGLVGVEQPGRPVRRAREQGWSWQDIAGVLGVSRQAVHQKHGGRITTTRSN